MELVMKTDNKTLIISARGDIDHHSAAEIKDKIDKKIARDNIKNVIFDFSKVSFMDSSGIGMIIGRYKLVEKKKGLACICGMSASVKKIYDISGLAKIVKAYNNVADAASSIQ